MVEAEATEDMVVVVVEAKEAGEEMVGGVLFPPMVVEEGEVEDPWPPSSRCGSPSRSTTSAAPPSSTASASKLPTLLKLIRLQLWNYIQPINFAILLFLHLRSKVV